MRTSILACIFLLASPLEARELHWRELAVTATLEDDGALRVSERQTMVFTGDWNGGERRFRVEPHQDLTIHGMTRVDADGTPHPLTDGDLNDVDHYRVVENNVLRWRARSPNDPEFANTEIVYVIDYTIGRALTPAVWPPRSNAYLLKHDFAFTDRPGPIERFSYELALGPAWTTTDDRRLHGRARNLLPGESVIAEIPLAFRGAQRPASMSYARSLGTAAKPWLLGIAMLLALLVFLLLEWLRGRTI